MHGFQCTKIIFLVKIFSQMQENNDEKKNVPRKRVKDSTRGWS